MKKGMAEREREREREKEKEREGRSKEERKRSSVKKTWMHLSRVGKNEVTLSEGLLHSSLAHSLAYHTRDKDSRRVARSFKTSIQCKRKG